MTLPLISALLLTGSRDSWVSFGLGLAAGLALLLLSKRLRRRKEDR